LRDLQFFRQLVPTLSHGLELLMVGFGQIGELRAILPQHDVGPISGCQVAGQTEQDQQAYSDGVLHGARLIKRMEVLAERVPT
jgi:hypothetical protein